MYYSAAMLHLPETMIVVGALVAIAVAAHLFRLADLRPKTSGGGLGAGLTGVVDEIFAPSRYEAIVHHDAQTILPARAPLPGEPEWGAAGRVTLVVAGPASAPRVPNVE
jgi:hypothetical protein